MKSPITGKEMSLQTKSQQITFRKEEFKVEYPSFYCKDSGEYFTTTQFDTIKMKQVYNQYRDKHNIPFPEEIINIRTTYNLSATKMSEILGFGVNSYRKYENGEVPNQSNANLIQGISDPSYFKKLVEISTAYPGNSTVKEKLLNHIDKLISIRKKNAFTLRFNDYLLGAKLPDNYSGYLKPNIEKLTEMVVFFANSMQPYVTKLNKLLFYSDFLHYKLQAVSISGIRYRAIDKGPVPDGFYSIFDFISREEAIIINREEHEWGFAEKFVPNPAKSFNKDLFSKSELEVLEKVSVAFKDKKVKEIVEISHIEPAWKDNFTNGKSLIDYKYAIQLKYLGYPIQ